MKHMAREQITWHTEPNDSSVLPLPSSSHSIASLSYLLLIFCGGSFTFFFGFLGPRTRTQLSWVDVKCEEDFLAIFTATAQMNDHYADLKWKQRLKWICNEPNEGTEQREKERGSERGTETSPKVDDQLSALQWVVTQFPLPSPQSQPVEGHASIE